MTKRKSFGKLASCAAICLCGVAAMAYDTLPSWTLTWTNAARNVGILATDAAHGGWTLNVRKNTYYGGYGLTLGIYSGKAFYGSAVASGGGDTGELDMRGTITGPGLDGTGTSTEWKIANMPDACLRTDDGNGNANPAYAVKILRTPGTLLTWGPPYHNDGNPKPLVTEVHVDEPEITSAVPSWFCSGCTILSVFTLKVPKSQVLNSYIAHWQTPRAATSFDDYDLSSIKTVTGGSGSKGDGGSLQSWAATGTLDLPSLETITYSNACKNASNLGAVLLGTKGTLKSIGEQSFIGCNNLSNVVFGASPKGVTLTIGQSAFAGTGLKKIWFAGANPPKLVLKSGAYTFGTSATPEGQITFYVPDTPGWADVLAQRDGSDLVPASVFNTARKQKVLTWGGAAYLKAVSPADRTLALTHGDTISMASSASNPSEFPYASAARGLYLLPATLTASTSGTPDAEGRSSAFYRWVGVPADQEQDNPLTLQAGVQAEDVRAFFAHDWVYDASAQTIANGNWVITVSVVDADSRTLRIGANTANPVNTTFSTAFTGTGSGVLDFNGHVRDAQGNEWTLVDVKAYAMCRARAWTSADSTQTFAIDHPDTVVFPETLTSIGSDIFNFNQSQAFPLSEVILIAPNLTGKLRFVVNGSSLLNRMTLRVPKVTSLEWMLWQNAQLNQTSVTDWDLSSVTSISEGTFQCSTGMSGILKLPSLVNLGHRNFAGHSKLDGIVLATNLTLTTVGSNAFLNATSLKSVTVGNSTNGVTVGQNAFKGATGVSAVTFLGPRDETLADATLTGVAATSGGKAATIRASAAFGWNESVAAPTGDEVAAMPPTAAGVYRAGSRKAWLEYAPSPFEPRGTIIIFR